MRAHSIHSFIHSFVCSFVRSFVFLSFFGLKKTKLRYRALMPLYFRLLKRTKFVFMFTIICYSFAFLVFVSFNVTNSSNGLNDFTTKMKN